MLSAMCLGSLWGAVLGRYLRLSIEEFRLAQVLIILLLTFLVFIFPKSRKLNPSQSILFSLVLAMLSAVWTAIHNPAQISVYDRDLKVLWSVGCAESDREILVDDGFQIYTARGSALSGDLVKLAANNFKSRFSITTTVGHLAGESLICQTFGSIRAEIYKSLNAFPLDMRRWLAGFALGKGSDVDKELMATFRNVGLLHVLVLSGSHLSVIAGMLLFFLRAPFLVLYFFRVMDAQRWVYVLHISVLIAVLLLFLFCAVVGFAQSVQRAFLNFCVCHLAGMMGFAQDTRTKIKLTFFAQALIFPVNLLSVSLILSWTGTLILHAFYESTYLKSNFAIFSQLAKIQLVFFASTLVFFGQAGLLSPLANLLALPVLAILLPLDLIALTMRAAWLNEWLIALNRLAIKSVQLLEHYQSNLPISYIGLPKDLTLEGITGRVGIFLAIMIFFLLSGLRQQDHVASRRDLDA